MSNNEKYFHEGKERRGGVSQKPVGEKPPAPKPLSPKSGNTTGSQ